MENLKTKSRKIAKSREYKLPTKYLDDNFDEQIFDEQFEQEQADRNELWLESFSGKNEYQITEMLFAQTW